MLARRKNPEPPKSKVTSATLQLLLESATNTESNAELQKIGKALALAKATDGTDVDDRIAAFATKGPELSVRAKEILISEVLRSRNNPVIMPAMLELAASSDEPALVVAALQAVRQMAGDDQFDRLLKIIESTDNNRSATPPRRTSSKSSGKPATWQISPSNSKPPTKATSNRMIQRTSAALA